MAASKGSKVLGTTGSAAYKKYAASLYGTPFPSSYGPKTTDRKMVGKPSLGNKSQSYGKAPKKIGPMIPSRKK